MSGRPRRSGPVLPYRLLAGVVPTARGWLTLTGKLQGITLLPERAELMPTLLDVLDYRPSFDVVALHAPLGLPPAGTRGRSCEVEARRILGYPRASAVAMTPNRDVLETSDYDEARRRNGGRLSIVEWMTLPHVAEVARDVGTWHQRQVYEIHPELSYYQANEDVPMRHSKHSGLGQLERRTLTERRLPGIDRIYAEPPRGIPFGKLLDAGAALWTSRRIAARAVTRIPQDPEWDDEGLRMEMVR